MRLKEMDDAEVARLVDAVIRLKEMALEAAGDRRPWSGTLPCPACAVGQVSCRLRSNSHLWARCDSPECMSFVE